MSGWRHPYVKDSITGKAGIKAKLVPQHYPFESRRKLGRGWDIKTEFRFVLSIESPEIRFPGILPLLADGGIQRAFAGLNKGTQARSQEGQRDLWDSVCKVWARSMMVVGRGVVDGLIRSCTWGQWDRRADQTVGGENSLAVQWLGHCVCWVQSLARKLRSRKPWWVGPETNTNPDSLTGDKGKTGWMGW